MAAHAKWFGASSSKKWLTCAASIQREEGLPNKSSDDAMWGTACHFISEQVLLGKLESAATAIGKTVVEWSHAKSGSYGTDFLCSFDGNPDAENLVFHGVVEVDEEMAQTSKVYTDFVQHLVETTGGDLHVEQRVDYRRWLAVGIGEDDGFGTADAVITDFINRELMVIDLKGGAGVSVDAVGNTQMRLYALGALHAHSFMGGFDQIRMVIVQPRNGGIKEEVISLDNLIAFGEHVRWVSQRIVDAITLGESLPASVSEEGCRWCRAKATCPDLQADVLATVFGDFDDLSAADVTVPHAHELPAVWEKRDLIRGFMSAVEERMLEETRAGTFPDYKIVEGRRGNRTWQKPEEAEAALKGMRLKQDEMYTMKLVGPAVIEKVLKERPRSWNKVKPMIVQPAGKETVAHISDPRPAKPSVADDFDDCNTTATPTADADLF